MEAKKSIYEWMAEDGTTSAFESRLLLKAEQDGLLTEPVSEETDPPASDEGVKLHVVSADEGAQSTETGKDYQCTSDEFEALKTAVMKDCVIEVTPRQRAWITETIRAELQTLKTEILGEQKS